MLIGLDVGGTNIDAVIIKGGKIINKVKSPLYGKELLDSILDTLDKLLEGFDKSQIKRVNLSTTICTNAIVKNEILSVGMLIQSGPGLPTKGLSCGNANHFLAGSIDHRGRVTEDLDADEISQAIKEFKDKKINHCAVVTKFSTRNPKVEIKIKDMLDEHFDFITTGHSISGKLNFPRRVYTSYLNSAVYSTFKDFADKIEESFTRQGINAPIYILKADGGTMDLNSARKKPVESILSGPAASFMGIEALLPVGGDGIFLDIGGTTTDIFFLVNGSPLFKQEGIKIDKYKTLVRSIYSVSIGLGGDSRIKIEDGKLEIGPDKEARPYCQGGEEPTPTDAMLALGLMEDGDQERSRYIMEDMGRRLNKSGDDMANLILDTMGDIIKDKIDSLLEEINSKPVYTVKEVLYGREVRPEHINIIGGPAKSLTATLEEKLGLPCNFPKNYHIANAVGATLAKPTQDITLMADTEQGFITIPELNVHESIRGEYNLQMAKEQAVKLLVEHINLMDSEMLITQKDIEITEESSFNMVDGFYTRGQNIRVEAQVKPGLIHTLRSE